MSGEHFADNKAPTGAAVATSEDISPSKRGVNGDKDNLLEGNGSLHRRKIPSPNADPELGVAENQQRHDTNSSVPNLQGTHLT